MNRTETKASHFVWRKYLEQFSDQNIICVLNIKTNAQIKTSTKNIAKINHICDLSNISDVEKQNLIKFANHSTSFPDSFMKDMIDDFVSFINSDVSKIISNQNNPALIQDAMQKFHDAFGMKRLNSQELLFTYYESNFMNIFNWLLNKDASFLQIDSSFEDAYNNYEKILIARMSMLWWAELVATMLVVPYGKKNDEMRAYSKEIRKKTTDAQNEVLIDLLKERSMTKADLDRFDFLVFILSSSFRTHKNIKTINNLMNADSRFQSLKIRPQVLQCYMNHISIHQIAINLIKKEFKLVFLVNGNAKNLITSDQPVVNTYVDFGRHDEFYEIYYPLSPKLAILYTDRDCYSQTHEIPLNDEDVIQYNKLLSRHCNEYVYCYSFDDLKE